MAKIPLQIRHNKIKFNLLINNSNNNNNNNSSCSSSNNSNNINNNNNFNRCNNKPKWTKTKDNSLTKWVRLLSINSNRCLRHKWCRILQWLLHPSQEIHNNNKWWCKTCVSLIQTLLWIRGCLGWSWCQWVSLWEVCLECLEWSWDSNSQVSYHSISNLSCLVSLHKMSNKWWWHSKLIFHDIMINNCLLLLRNPMAYQMWG